MPVSVSNPNLFFQSRNFRLPLLLLIWGEMEALFSTLFSYPDRKFWAGSLLLYLQRQKILQFLSAKKWKKSMCPWYDFLVVGSIFLLQFPCNLVGSFKNSSYIGLDGLDPIQRQTTVIMWGNSMVPRLSRLLWHSGLRWYQFRGTSTLFLWVQSANYPTQK